MTLLHRSHPPTCFVPNALVEFVSKDVACLIADYACDEAFTVHRRELVPSSRPNCAVAAFSTVIDGLSTACIIQATQQNELKFQYGEIKLCFKTRVATLLHAIHAKCVTWACRGPTIIAVFKFLDQYWLKTFVLAQDSCSDGDPIPLIWSDNNIKRAVFDMQAHPSEPLVYVLTTDMTNRDCLTVLSDDGKKVSEVTVPNVYTRTKVNRQGYLYCVSIDDRRVLVIDPNTGTTLQRSKKEELRILVAFLGEHNGHMLFADVKFHNSDERIQVYRLSCDRNCDDGTTNNNNNLTICPTVIMGFPASFNDLHIQASANRVGLAWSNLTCSYDKWWSFAEIKHQTVE
jgi:hypothetical protein